MDKKTGFKHDGRRPSGRRPGMKDIPSKRKPGGDRPRRDGAPFAPPSPARMAAHRVLMDYSAKKSFASLALDKELDRSGMSFADRRLCTAIVYTVIENIICLDHILSFYLADMEKVDPQIMMILRAAVAQAEFMDRIPENALVDEAVKCARAVGLNALTGLVNGVLRSYLRKEKTVTYPDDETEKMSILYSYPSWILQRFTKDYGKETAREICAYHDRDHSLIVRSNALKVSESAFRKILEGKVWESKKSPYLDAWCINGAQQITSDRDYRDGAFTIESISSMLAAEAVQAKRGMQILDCCAAPGGKTAYLAEKMENTGRIYAWDLHEHRIELLKALMRRLGIDNVRPAVRDAASFVPNFEELMDAVLVDAPCSGLGVADDKPDIKYRLRPEDIENITRIQYAILSVCSRYVRRGGTLVYSTCSILKSENEEQISRFLAEHPDFSVVQLPDTYPGELRAYAGPFGLTILPHRDGIPGFFIAKMVRES